MGCPFCHLEYRLNIAFELPLEYPRVPPGLLTPWLPLGASVPRPARCAVGAVQAALVSAGPSPGGVLAWYSRVLTASMGHSHSWPRKHARAAEWTARKQPVLLSGNGSSWSGCKCESTARTAPPSGQPESVSATPTHGRMHACPQDSPTRRPNAPWLSMPSGVVGNNATLLVVLAATSASLLVVIIVMIVRNRRAARATNPASDVRTLLYVDDSSSGRRAP
jgi:hypothetical protein